MTQPPSRRHGHADAIADLADARRAVNTLGPSPAPQLRVLAYLLALPGLNAGTASRLASGTAKRATSGGATRWLIEAALSPLHAAKAAALAAADHSSSAGREERRGALLFFARAVASGVYGEEYGVRCAAAVTGREPGDVAEAMLDLAAAEADYEGLADHSIDPATLLDVPGRNPWDEAMNDAEGRREDALSRLIGCAS